MEVLDRERIASPEIVALDYAVAIERVRYEVLVREEGYIQSLEQKFEIGKRGEARLLRQSVFGRLAGYDDVNDAERLAHDPVMRAIVDRGGIGGAAASSSQIGRFETEWLASDDNLAALSDLSGGQ